MNTATTEIPKRQKKEDNKPIDSPYNQPQDNNTSQKKIAGNYYIDAYQMHIENRQILSRGGSSLRLKAGKASKNKE